MALPCVGQVTARPVITATPPAQAATPNKPAASTGGAGVTKTLEPPKNNSRALSP